MSIFDKWISQFTFSLSERVVEQLRMMRTTVDYRSGRQPPQLRVKPNQADDNLTVNFCGLIVDRAVSSMLGDGVKFDLPGENESTESQYIDALWNANRKQVLLHAAAMTAADYGTGYIKILPDGVIGKDGRIYPRLVVLTPSLVTVDTMPDDKDLIIRYRIEYQIEGVDGKPMVRRETHELNEAGTWDVITDERRSLGNWTRVDEKVWPYDFPQIIHWQNLPNPYDVQGDPELTEDVLTLQDRLNYTASNESKIIRLYAHPMRYGKGLGNNDKLQVGPDEMPNVSQSASIEQLDSVGDLPGVNGFVHFLRQSLFDIARTVDIDSLQDKLGALTNFALRVLYADNLSKIETKRLLFGEALLELNRRLLVMAGMTPDPGEIVWPDILPTNEQEQVLYITSDLANGLVSKQTASKRRGYNYEDEQERMEGEAVAGDNVGAALLRAFSGGQQ